jgi:PKD repeat protein
MPRDRVVTVALTGSDPDGSLAAGALAWGDGAETTLTAGNLSVLNAADTLQLTHQYLEGASYTMTATLTDDRGASTSDTLVVDLVVPYVAPTLDLIASGEDMTASASIVATTYNDNPVRLMVDWGDGAVEFLPTSGARTHHYAAPGSYAVTATLWDDTGGTITESAWVALRHTPITAALAGVSLAGTTLTLTPSTTQPVPRLLIEWGDGSTTPAHDGVSLQHTYAPGVACLARARFTAADGTAGASPAVILVTPPEGIAALALMGDPLDPAAQTLTVSATDADGLPLIAWNYTWQDAETAGVVGAPVTLTLPSGDHALSVQWTTQAGGARAGIILHGGNRAPRVTVSLDSVRGLDVRITPLATDRDGVVDAVTIAWGDGTLSTGVIADGATAATHTYTAPGTYWVLVTVTDDDESATSVPMGVAVPQTPAASFTTLRARLAAR